MLKEKCTNALDVIKVVTHSKWGADKISSPTCPIYIRLWLHYMDRLDLHILKDLMQFTIKDFGYAFVSFEPLR